MDKAHILIAEDEVMVALGIKNRLEGLGYAVSAVVSSGEQAIQKVVEMPPDLVLMDIKLKGSIDGVEATERIKARFDIPVVYLTACADEATLQRAKTTEPFGYLFKPFEARELHTTIEMALYKHKMGRRLRESERWLATTLNSIGEAVIATDAQGSIRFMNPVAEALTGWKQEEALGKDLMRVFKIIDERTRTLGNNPVTQVVQQGRGDGLGNHTLLVTRNDMEIPIDESVAPIRDDQGNIAGAVLVFRDISDRVQAEQAREKLIAEFQGALAKVKTLSGLLPICSSCKKIRDDQGYWQQVEVYIRDHSDAEFSHGLCPDCLKRLYPGFYP